MINEKQQQVEVPVFVALDFAHAHEARELVQKLGEHHSHYKIGLQLYLAAGRAFVSELESEGKSIFLDLKFHDIPNTVHFAVAEAAKLGVDFVTIHAGGGKEMMKSAVEAAHHHSLPQHQTKVLAVTLLTSLHVNDLVQLGYMTTDLVKQVQRLTYLAQDCNVHGVVCSAHEVAAVKASTGLKTMVPGIRTSGDAKGDQARVATPEYAVQCGADYLVVGRPITQAANPVQALQELKALISGSQHETGEMNV
ncbi:MAG: orotidine-5'-phosphate decarboxylase [Acidibacillus sp.]|uniref:Orotidine 5'-phosphate decarboxylase n=1 Tax=Sulfoacidibacillus ferrooxidans TaxID=2005001 RepID=A0A9X1VAC0_9BACL|nr:Orotidine 5'-phosphate decarboxylase [Sulfoacidibacillus ferrooxidans]MCY0892961.1 orotidine-5'-phosphate decarboxylase [Acidibacillus sp.]